MCFVHLSIERSIYVTDLGQGKEADKKEKSYFPFYTNKTS